MMYINPLVQRFILTCSIFLLVISVHAQESFSTVGKDFWLGFMNNNDGVNEDGTNDGRELRLMISGEAATTGTVSVPLQGWSTTFAITPNNVTTIIIPNAVAEHLSNDLVDTRGVHIEALEMVSVVAINYGQLSSDGTVVLPLKSLGTEYLISSYEGFSGGLKLFESEFLIVATQDGTQIEITPSVTTGGGHIAGVAYVIDLNEGETYQVYAAGITDLTGTRVKATAQSGVCRPFAVFGGSQCSFVPNGGCSACDHLYEQMHPVALWGTEYYVVHFLNTNRYSYKIIAKYDGTLVTVNNGVPIAMAAGQVIQENVSVQGVTNPTFKISANKPIGVTQYMNGYSCSGTAGDPSMLVLNADNQQIKSATFSTGTSININQHCLTIIVETVDVGTVLFDNSIISSSEFKMFPGNSAKSYARLRFVAGTYSVSATNGFIAYAYGAGYAESYAYSLGAFEPSAPDVVIDSVICSSDTIILIPKEPLSSPVWTTSADPTTVIGTGDSLLLVPPILNEVYLVTGNSIEFGCPLKFSFTVTAPDSIIFTMNTALDTVCPFSAVEYGVTLTTPGNYLYSWTPAALFDDPESASPTLTIEQNEWVYVTVVNPLGCTHKDSTLVHVSEIPEVTLPADTTICIGSTYLIKSTSNVSLPNYLWNTADTVADLITSSEGLFWLEASTSCGSDRDSMTIAYYNSFTVDLGNDTTLCIGDSLNLTPSIPIGGDITWSDGSKNTTLTVSSPSDIWVTISDVNGCEVNDSIGVAYFKALTFDLGQDYSICIEDVISISYLGNEFDSIVWNDATKTNSYTYTNVISVNDTITLSAIAYSCGSIGDTIRIYVEACSCPVFVPNTFNPNSDQENKTFKVYHECLFEEFNFIIFNRWGEVLFETQSPNFEWDGSFKGGPVESDTYVWKMEYLLSKESVKHAEYQVEVGHVNVLK
jgi:gliding motility-associated-like protein